MTPSDLLQSVFAELPIPFGIDAKVHFAGLRALVDYLERSSLDGLSVGLGRAGRGPRFDPGERREILTWCREGLGTRRRLIASVASAIGEREPAKVISSAVELARDAAELGVDALLIHPPTSFRGRIDQDRLSLEYHAEIAATGLPQIVSYLDEGSGGISYAPGTLAQLLARPRVLGVRVAVFDRLSIFQQIAALVKEHAPEKVSISGEDRMLGFSLMSGASAVMGSMAAVRPDLVTSLSKSYWSGDGDTFLKTDARLTPLAQAVFRPPFDGVPGRILRCLAIEGVLHENATHDPSGSRPGLAEIERLHAGLAAAQSDLDPTLKPRRRDLEGLP